MTCASTKICPTCQIPKLLTEFWKSRKSKYGLQAHCKSCQAIRKRRSDPNASEKPRAVLIAKPQKAQPTVDSELAIVLPSISRSRIGEKDTHPLISRAELTTQLLAFVPSKKPGKLENQCAERSSNWRFTRTPKRTPGKGGRPPVTTKATRRTSKYV